MERRTQSQMSENLSNLIIVALVAAIVVAIVIYLYREKKRGVTCVGCPYAKQCASKHGGNTAHSSCTGETSCGISDELADEIAAKIRSAGCLH